jgi:hypothetical protein
VSALGWFLFAACCLVCGIIGWTLRGYLEEVRQGEAEREADEAFDREYGIGGDR